MTIMQMDFPLSTLVGLAALVAAFMYVFRWWYAALIGFIEIGTKGENAPPPTAEPAAE
ncbi:hypothetical protein [Desulfohalovibrio reitneri]|uniref:hypothetical protein n=1 Tax=Desulfohalovibrio reitneri TaxID=1307759 RepID=UPI000B1D708D|nr:hypothetical protein [Desulfohalovibrio reitneri]